MDLESCGGGRMIIDKYVYPGTNVLKNKKNIRHFQALSDAERTCSSLNIIRLRQLGITGRFGISHLQSIHRELFGDIYEWAGEFRNIDIYKGGTEFVTPDEIESELNSLCSNIKSKNYFRCLSKQETVDYLADTMCKLNLIHPFREGNGRTQRIFLEQMALNAGYDLDFSQISENDMRDASRTGVRNDTRLMRYLFDNHMTEIGELGSVSVDVAVSKKVKSCTCRALPFLPNMRSSKTDDLEL